MKLLHKIFGFQNKPEKKKNVRLPSFDYAAYFHQTVLVEQDDFEIKHPSLELWFREHVRYLCRRPLGTRTVYLLEEMYTQTDDPILRSSLAKKSYRLRQDYLNSHNEYSDRALIRLCTREKYFDKWEGIYILGCFGGEPASNYLQQRLKKEQDPLLRQTMSRAIEKIKMNQLRKKQKRGF